MTEQEITNWLCFGIAVAWFCKIGFHFAYLKSADMRMIKESSFVSFYLKIENIFASFLLVSPLFFAKSGNEEGVNEPKKWRARISVYVLWTMFIMTGSYLYQHPPKKGTTTIEYDVTKSEVR
jgi:hypothetical protein